MDPELSSITFCDTIPEGEEPPADPKRTVQRGNDTAAPSGTRSIAHHRKDHIPMRKAILTAAAALATVAVLSGCSGAAGSAEGSDGKTLKVAAFAGGYGKDMYADAVAAYEKQNPDVKVELTATKTLAQELTPQVAAGKYPDVVILGQGAKEGFVEGFIRDKNLADLSDVLDMTVPGEKQTVKEKLTEGIVGNLNTNPYGDDKTYLMPVNASPTGLVFNKGLFEQKGWEVPTTWDEFFALGDKAKAEGISLFTYPTTGYLDSYFFSLLAAVGGEDFYNDVMTYKKDVWETPEAKKALQLTTKLLTEYTAPDTVGYANNQDFTKNQQTILNDTVLFMPNGTWIDNEMKDAPRADGFQWGLMPVPAVKKDGDRYATTFVESAWVPKEAANVEGAKKFIAFLYSDEVAKIFEKSGAIQPISSIVPTLTGTTADFYSVYSEPNVKALVGSFAATKPVAGVDIKATLFDSANSVVSGSMSQSQWQSAVNEASNKLSAAVQK
jgi:N-acetylglucosamine transport system substrate-binding protein